VNVALKIQRRRYAREATWEIYVHHLVREGAPCPDVIGLREYFLHDGHVCMVFEKHGQSLDAVLDRGPLPVAEVRHATRQILAALARIHSVAHAHSDVKPCNILYDPRTGDARLADLGCATGRLRQGSHPGTREYMAPEILIGSPLSPAIDLWSLGCTVFEMLTGRHLFSPRRAAARKYREFSGDAPPVPLDASVLTDAQAEAAEQYPRGTIIAGKYELKRRLGQGRFGTVWSASRLHARPLGNSPDLVWEHAMATESRSKSKTASEADDELWRRTKGADDIVDLALRYEHLILVASHCGPFPAQMISSAKYRATYFEADGEHRFRPVIRRVSIRERLRNASHLRGKALDGATGFICALVQLDPSERASADVALAHPWLARDRTAPR
jgi:serine/threonine protein kinase